MNRNHRRLGAAMLALVICVTVTPIAVARPKQNRPKFDPVEPVTRVIAKIKNILGRIGPLDDFPTPPTPKP